MKTTSWLHVSEGLFFRRCEDGSVEIGQGPDFNSVAPLQKIPPTQWASVVAYVSHAGEDGATYSQAIDFHQGKPGEAEPVE
jgi:hypothetical protein